MIFLHLISRSYQKKTWKLCVVKSQKFKISTFEKSKILLQEVCILTKSNFDKHNYLIGCTFIENSNFYKKYQLNFNTIEQNYSIITNEIQSCTDLIVSSQKQLVLFCHNQHQFKFYWVQENQNQSMHSQQFQKQNDCKIKLTQIDNLFFINYIKCDQWIIYSIDENFNISVYLDFNHQFKQAKYEMLNVVQLLNVQSCQNKMFLVFRNGYIYKYSKRNQLLEQIQLVNIKKDESIEFLILKNCIPHLFVVSLNDSVFAFHKDQRIFISTVPKSIYQLNEIAVITKENQLIFYITKNISKIYYLNFTKLDEFPESNQLYLINQRSLEVQFFTLQLRSFLKLEKKYFYEIVNPNFFNSDIINCLEILKTETQLKSIKYPVSYIENNCEVEKLITFVKDVEFLGSQTFMLPSQEYILQNGTIVINVFDRIGFANLCESKYLQDQNAEILDIDISRERLIILVNQKIHDIDFMDNEFFMEIDVTGKQVLNARDFVIIYASEIKELNIKNWLGSFFPFKDVDGIIEQIQIFPDQLLVKVKGNDFLYVTSYKYIINPNGSLLYQFDYKPFKPSNIRFYYQTEEIMIIQYDKFVQVILKYGMWLQNIQDIQVFFAEELNSGILVIGLHDSEQLIRVYFIGENNLIEIQSIIEHEYTFVRPIMYEEGSRKFVILAKEEKNFVLLCYKFSENFLILTQIIKTHKSVFFLSKSRLVYYNLNNTIDILDLDRFYLNIKFNSYKQANWIEKIQVQINFIFQKNLELQLQGIVNLHLINFCLNIFPKNQLLKLNYDLKTEKNQQISLNINPTSEFIGQVQNYHFDSDDIIINGPFIFETYIKNCLISKSGQCLKLVSLNCQNKIINFHETYIVDKYLELVNINQPNPFKLYNSTFIIIIQDDIYLIAIIFEKLNQFNNYTIIQELKLHNREKNLVIEQENIFVDVQNQMYLVLLNNYLLNLLYFDGEKIVEIMVEENILDAIMIENSQEMVLFLYQNSTEILELVVQQVQNNNILLRKTINTQLFNFDLEFFKMDQKQFDFISAKKYDEILELSLIYFTNIITRFIYLKINMTDLDFAFRIEKNLRMPHKYNGQFSSYYLFENHFIFSIQKSDYLYYNLSEQQDLYDFSKMNSLNFYFIQRFNSTHFLFKYSGLIIIGRIEFQLTFNKMNQTIQKTNLIASNEVSNASITITIEQNIIIPQKNNQQKFHYIIFIGFLVILFFLFIFRRKKLQQRVLQIE